MAAIRLPLCAGIKMGKDDPLSNTVARAPPQKKIYIVELYVKCELDLHEAEYTRMIRDFVFFCFVFKMLSIKRELDASIAFDGSVIVVGYVHPSSSHIVYKFVVRAVFPFEQRPLANFFFYREVAVSCTFPL